MGFVIWALCSSKGGLERSGVALAHAMHARGHEPVLFCQVSNPGHEARPVYPVDPAIRIAPFALRDTDSMAYARKLIMNCGLDVLCAMFSWDSLLWFPALLNNTGLPLLISERSKPEAIERERWNAYEHMACMAGADAIQVLNQSFKEFYPQFLQDRISVISNPAPQPKAVAWEREKAPRKRLLAVGRLTGLKQFPLLIQAFFLLASTFPDWDLHICGEGEERSLCEAYIAQCGLGSRVFLQGIVEDMDSEYAASHLFCIPSRFEGFPLVTIEAQSHALPVIGFAQCSGVNEIIIHGENGILMEEMEPQALAAGLRTLMKSASLRRRMGEQGQKLLARYEAGAVYDQWEALLHRTSMAKGNTRLNFPKLSPQAAAKLALQEVLHRPHPFFRPTGRQ
jgi:glycosyltransferase involved in cell wall biosynthesis